VAGLGPTQPARPDAPSTSAWLCLHIPELALQALSPLVGGFSAGSDNVKPWVVLRGANSSQIIAVSSHAAVLGIGCKHSLAQARAIAPILTTLVRQPAREAALLEDLACVAYQFSHQIVLGAPPQQGKHAPDFSRPAREPTADQPNSAWLALEIAASLTLFGGLAALLAALRPRLAAFALRLQLGVAPTPEGARVLAQTATHGHVRCARQWPQSLHRIALVHSALTPETIAALASVGVTTFAALCALPSAGLRKRFGADCMRYLAALQTPTHDAPTVQHYWRPPQQFQRHLEFGFSAESTALLAFPVKRLLRELTLYLEACDAAVQELTLALQHQSKPTTLVVINMLSVTRDALILQSLVNTRFENLTLVEGVIGLGLSVHRVLASTAHTPDLFAATAGASLPLPRLLERLQNKLGTNKHGRAAVSRLHWQHEHRPELASRSQPLGPQQVPAKASKATQTTAPRMALRPLWLITPEQICASSFTLLSGPERIESGWWDSAQLGDVRRDYYIAQLHNGTRIWIYVLRPPGVSQLTSEPQWHLHGYF
jgi:protein ImuB